MTHRQSLKALLVGFLVLLASASVAWGQIDADVMARAKAGDAIDQYNLAVMYYIGMGVPRDYEKAVGWFRKSAEQGFWNAQHNLATMYAGGEGVTQSDSEAVKWFRKAAEQGLAGAQNSLAAMYHTGGKGVTKDKEEALKWYRKAAEQGLVDAQVNLGMVLYREGQGLVPLNEEAATWLRTAAEQGNFVAQYELGLMYAKGDGVVQNDVLALMWIQLAASQQLRINKEAEPLRRRMTREQTAESLRLQKEWVSNFSPQGTMSRELVKRNGLVYEVNKEEPFTGKFVTYWDSAQQKRKEELNYRAGKRHGMAISWYESGQKLIEGHFTNGLHDGVMTRWYDDGTVQMKQAYEDGDRNGKTITWFEDGQQEGEANYKDGKLEGKFTFWHRNGKKKTVGVYKNGELVDKLCCD